MAAFEPNAGPLWQTLREKITAFLHGLFQQRALPGATPREAFFVHLGAQTTTAADLATGLLNIEIGFAPIRPAEFVILRIPIRSQPAPTP